jgi:hypothetical protein
MTLGDRLCTGGRSRLELQTGGGAIYVAPETDLTATDLTYGQLVRVPILGGEDPGVKYRSRV